MLLRGHNKAGDAFTLPEFYYSLAHFRMSHSVLQIGKQRSLNRRGGGISQMEKEDSSRNTGILIIQGNERVKRFHRHVQRHLWIVEIDPGEREFPYELALPYMRKA